MLLSSRLSPSPSLTASRWSLPTAAYVHIPFCRRRCFYCDFPISVLGDQARGETAPAIAHYVDVLCQEIALAERPPQPLATIFFGGGTPSLLSVQQLEQILRALEQRLGIAAHAEISMEVDPGTFTLDQIQGYRQLGVNRLSLGAQAFQTELLAGCGRSHTVEEIYTAVATIQQAGVTNFGLDLISGLPNQTLSQWQASLQAVIDLQPTHVSTYDLVLEPGTVFGKRYQPGDAPLPSDQNAAQMYRLAAAMLKEAGYEHYEISNFAQPDYHCRHNRVYWQNQPYYGFGMGATSYLKGQRFSRPRTRQAYYAWVEALAENDGAITCPVVTPEDEWLETLMMGLRLSEGVFLESLSARFGTELVDRLINGLERDRQRGWVEINPDSRRLYLTDPEGFLFCNQVLLTIWREFDFESDLYFSRK